MSDHFRRRMNAMCLQDVLCGAPSHFQMPSAWETRDDAHSVGLMLLHFYYENRLSNVSETEIAFPKITAYKGTCVVFTVQKTNKFVVFLSAPVEDEGAREIQIWYELLNKGVWDWRKRPNNGDNRRDQQNVWYFGCYITYYYKWNRNGRGCRRTGTDKLDNFWRWTFGYVMRCCVRSSRTVNDHFACFEF